MIKPYYETKLGKLYHGDCLDVLPHLDVEVDLVLTDPPYGIKADKGVQEAKCRIAVSNTYEDKWDSETPDKNIFNFLLKNDCIIFGGYFFTHFLPQGNHWLVWDKLNLMPTFSDCELMYTNIERNSVKKYECRWSGMMQSDMKQKEAHYHPTQKPVKLIKDILKDYSQPNDLILDPFLGSGTTAVAAESLNRRWIGIEKEERYIEIAIQRLESEVQYELF